MHDDDLLKPGEAADYLKRPERTLRQWRYDRKGPAYVKVGSAVRYRRGDLVAWVNAHRVEPGRG